MVKVIEQMQQHFEIDISCKKCGSKNVEIEFYAGFIHSCGGDTGGLSVNCCDCKNKVDIDEDDGCGDLCVIYRVINQPIQG